MSTSGARACLLHNVVAVAGPKAVDIVAAATDQQIGAGAAVQLVGPAEPLDAVVSTTSVDLFAPGMPPDVVVSGAGVVGVVRRPQPRNTPNGAVGETNLLDLVVGTLGRREVLERDGVAVRELLAGERVDRQPAPDDEVLQFGAGT